MNKRLIPLACVVIMLSACGGAGSGESPAPAPTAQVPASASQSVEGMMSYLGVLIASRADGLEPVDLGAATAPTGDTIEPQPIN